MPLQLDFLLVLVGLVLILAGLAGVLLPALPGAPLIFLGSLCLGWAEGFTRIGWLPLTVIGLLAVVSFVVDHAAGVLGARRAGASRWGLAGAVIGLLLGLPLGLPGIIFGPAIGATALEYAKDPDMRRAAKAGAGVFVGFLIGTALKYALAATMIGVLLLAIVW